MKVENGVWRRLIQSRNSDTFAEEPSIGYILEVIDTVEMVAAVPLFAGQSHHNAESTYLQAKIEHAALVRKAICKLSKRRLEPQRLRMTYIHRHIHDRLRIRIGLGLG